VSSRDVVGVSRVKNQDGDRAEGQGRRLPARGNETKYLKQNLTDTQKEDSCYNVVLADRCVMKTNISICKT